MAQTSGDRCPQNAEREGPCLSFQYLHIESSDIGIQNVVTDEGREKCAVAEVEDARSRPF